MLSTPLPALPSGPSPVPPFPTQSTHPTVSLWLLQMEDVLNSVVRFTPRHVVGASSSDIVLSLSSHSVGPSVLVPSVGRHTNFTNFFQCCRGSGGSSAKDKSAIKSQLSYTHPGAVFSEDSLPESTSPYLQSPPKKGNK